MLSEEGRREIRERQGNCCFYCHEPLQDGGDNPATIDHFIPRSLLRGLSEYFPENYVCACSKCNQDKADQIPEGWDRRIGNWQLTDFGNWVWCGGEATVDKEVSHD